MYRRDLLKGAVVSAAVGLSLGGREAYGSAATPNAQATPETERARVLLLQWELESMTRADGSTLTPDVASSHTIQLLDDGRVLVQADCNSGSGTYSLDGTTLKISSLMTTLVGCEPGSIGSDFSAAVSTVNEFRVTTDASDSLSLITDDGTTLTFNPGLSGVTWEFSRFQGGNGSELVVEDPSRYTLELPGDGNAIVRADCNRGTGSAAIDGNSIDLTVALTRAMCPPGSHSTDFVRYLDEAVSWVIRDGQLHLSLPADAGIASFTPVVPSEAPNATPESG
jgi:heat shock protein HslJ